MSESKFVGDMAQSFTERHPEKDGWSVYRLDNSWMYVVGVLPAFLREQEGAVIHREAICGLINWEGTKTRRRNSLRESPFRRRGQGLNELDWYGEIDFLWHGRPIHYSRQPAVLSKYGEVAVTFVAAKQRAAFESLFRALRGYSRKHSRLNSSITGLHGQPTARPKADWDELVLPGTMTEDIRRNVESFLIAKPQYKALRLPYRRGFLFAGPPGCGKTLAVRIIASKAKAAVFNLALQAKIKDDDIKYMFERAQEEAPSVLILEDLDRLAECAEVSLSFLLNLLDGLVANEGVMILATTNHPEKLDSALLHRPSRFDKVWHFPLPGFEERLILIRKKSLGHFGEAAIDDAARQSQGFTMAYVQEAVVNALLSALFEGREARDQDLAESVRKLKEQFSANFKADGVLHAINGVGFAAK